MEFFDKLSYRIVKNLVRSGVVKEEDAEIHMYGINQILMSVLNVSSTLIIGLFLGMFLESIIFMIAYIPLRSFAGGYHAKTALRCYFISIFIILIAIVFCKYVPFCALLHVGMLITGSILCFFLSPVQDNNKPLDDVEQKKYKQISIIILFIEIGLCIFFIFVLHRLESMMPIVIFTEAIMLVLGKIKNSIYC